MNKRIIIVLAVIFTLFLTSACVPISDNDDRLAKDTQPDSTGSDQQVAVPSAPLQPSQPVQQQVVSSESNPPVSNPVPVPVPSPIPAPDVPIGDTADPSTIPMLVSGQTDPKVQALITKAKSKASLGYTFYYTTTENWELWRDHYTVKDNFIKVKLYSVNLYDKQNYFDTVYLDTAKKTAIAYCEDKSSTRCIDPERKFVQDYDDFIIKTPSDWLHEIAGAEWFGSESFDERNANVVQYRRQNGEHVRIWVDAFSGIPVQVVVFGDDIEDVRERYGFRDLTVSVSSTKVHHQPLQ